MDNMTDSLRSSGHLPFSFQQLAAAGGAGDTPPVDLSWAPALGEPGPAICRTNLPEPGGQGPGMG